MTDHERDRKLFCKIKYWRNKMARIYDKEELTKLDQLQISNCKAMIAYLNNKQSNDKASSSKP